MQKKRIMELLFERHAEYLTDVPTSFEREKTSPR